MRPFPEQTRVKPSCDIPPVDHLSAGSANFFRTGVPHLQNNAPHQDPTAGPCLGPYGIIRGAMSYERGTPVD